MNPKLEKLLTLAFNKGASEPEAEAAFRAARQIVLKTGAYFKEALGADFTDYEAPPPTFPFGKYKGKDVLQVAKTDMPYLQWFASTVKDKPELVSYIKQVLNRYYQL
jgi:hypothetical protein